MYEAQKPKRHIGEYKEEPKVFSPKFTYIVNEVTLANF